VCVCVWEADVRITTYEVIYCYNASGLTLRSGFGIVRIKYRPKYPKVKPGVMWEPANGTYRRV